MTKILVPSRFTPLLTRIFFGLLYLLPGILFFSYHPVISLGSNDSMNFELSLPLIWLVMFAIVSFLTLISVAKTRNFGGITDRRFFFFSLIPFYLTVSIFWSANPVRGLLTAGISWLLFFAIFSILFFAPLLAHQYQKQSSYIRHYRAIILAVTLISGVIICAICWFQSIFDVIGIDRTQTLLCTGCTYSAFGFPHPSGLAIEPQFMGNLLLAPTLLSLYLLIFRRPSFTKTQLNWILGSAIILSLTLFFTFSRGAIYAYLIALFIMLIFVFKSRVAPVQIRTLLFISISTFVLSLFAQGIFAALSPTADTFLSGVTKSLHQLSLGVIDLRTLSDPKSTSPDSSSISTLDNPDSPHDETSTFSGYVPESTDIRLSLNQAAFETWTSSPLTVLFGVGFGGAGVAMRLHHPDVVSTPKEIVQNQYFSLLLEEGLTFVILVIFIASWTIFTTLKSRRANNSTYIFPSPLIVALLVAYLTTLNFFSGLPNALQIYLMPPLLCFAFLPLKHQKT